MSGAENLDKGAVDDHLRPNVNFGPIAVDFAPQQERFLQQSSDLETSGYDTRETERGRLQFNPIEI